MEPEAAKFEIARDFPFIIVLPTLFILYSDQNDKFTHLLWFTTNIEIFHFYYTIVYRVGGHFILGLMSSL